MGVTLTTEKIFNAFYSDYNKKKTFYHGHTYTANPVSCSAALASLQVFKKEGVLERARKEMPLFHRLMKEFISLDIVGDVRYIGLIGAIELVKDKVTKEPFGIRKRIGLEIYKEGLREGMILRPLGDIIYFYLPLCVKEGEIRTILRRAYRIIEKVSKN